jgi:hypothetical protein
MIISEYFKNLYSNKMKNLEEIDEFLGAFDLSNLSQKCIYCLHRSITTINELEAVIVSQERTTQDQM